MFQMNQKYYIAHRLLHCLKALEGAVLKVESETFETSAC